MARNYRPGDRSQVMDYESASDYLGDKEERPLSGVHTRLHRIDKRTIAVRYHWTDVVTYNKGRRTRINNGGWFTPTTKNRINEYTNAGISQMNFEWYVSGGRKFKEGMLV